MASSSEEMLALEAKVSQIATGRYLDDVAELRALLETEPGKVRARLLKLAAPNIGRDVLVALLGIFRIGAADAADVIGAASTVKPKLAAEVVRDVSGLASESKTAVTTAKALILAGVAPAVALAPVIADSNRIRKTLAVAVNQTRNDAVVAASLDADLPMTLVAERDACVHCLAHQGVVTKTGDFPAGLTYGGKPLKVSGRQGVPIHPYCRCRLVPMRAAEFASALRREADRSILRGFALPTESPKARVEAADRLLSSGVTAPESVKKLARRAVKDGRFPERATPESARR